MRTITIPKDMLLRAVNGSRTGARLVFTVDLGWPELRLTEAQVIANAFARASGERQPYPDLNIVAIELPCVETEVGR